VKVASVTGQEPPAISAASSLIVPDMLPKL
jgi:hypothetical protein